MQGSVLVVLDGRRAGERIVGWVRRLASGTGATVHLLTVREPGRLVRAGDRTVAFVDEVEAADRAEGLTYLAGIATRLGVAGIPTRLDVRVGRTVEAILDAQRDTRAGLVALATGDGGAPRGAVTEALVAELLRRVPVPVLIARAGLARAA